MAAATDPEDARGELDPDDAVGNILCDQLLESPDPALIRVLNHHGGWCESIPSWTDVRRTLDVCDDLAAQWSADEGSTILVRALKNGLYERVPVQDGATIANTSTVSADLIETLIDQRGEPDLIPLDAVHGHFWDGDPAPTEGGR